MVGDSNRDDLAALAPSAGATEVEPSDSFALAATGLAMLAEPSPDGAVPTKILRANAALAALVGRPVASLVELATLIDHDGRPAVQCALDEVWSRGTRRRLEARLATGDDRAVDVELTFTRVSTGDKHRVLVEAHDITRRRRTEDRLERYRLLAERARDVILFVRVGDGRIVEANDAAERAYGYSRSELLAMRIGDLRAEATHALIAPQMAAADVEGLVFETSHRRKDGTCFPVQVSSQGTTGRGERLLLSIIRDVTDRKRLHDQLLHADRLVALGTLTAAIVHEINNPLAWVGNSVALMQRRIDPDNAELVGLLDDVRDGVSRMREIVQSTHALLRAEEQPNKLLDVRDVLESTVQMTWFEIRGRAHLRREYGEVPLIRASEAQLGQVFLNLLINAVQSIPPDHLDDHEIVLSTGVGERGNVYVEVRDTGVGMPPAVLDRIFDPFFTTKPVGIGTGLGLSISQGIVTAMGGAITVQSTAGQGSTFRVSLPVSTLGESTTRASNVVPTSELPARSEIVARARADQDETPEAPAFGSRGK